MTHNGTHLFLRREVVHNVEQLANFFGCLALDHVRDGFAPNVAAISRYFSSRKYAWDVRTATT